MYSSDIMEGVRFNIDGGSSNIIGIDDKWGEITVYQNKSEVANAGFTIQYDQIYIDTIETVKEFQNKGYGTAIIDIIKGLSRIFNKAIIVDCDNEISYKFFMGRGFISYEDLIVVWIPEKLRCTTNEIIIKTS